ncbi:MAG TPA: hypothetical protein VFL29_14780 [Candidatus Dormibacteraeota bacterium]|nr:hypothetical protein [Candidatus Dormibacteraeota bacterium]
MVLTGTRGASLGVLAAGGGLGAFLAVIALLLGTPVLIAAIAPMFLVILYAAWSLARPVSLGVEGDEVVYRSGRNEKRFPRADVVSCTLGGAGWSFWNGHGTRLVALNAWRFDGADVAEFCAHAGIHWHGPSQRPADRVRRDIGVAKVFRAFSMFAGAGFVILMALSAWSEVTARGEEMQYRAAPVCTPTHESNCRLQTQARVVSVDTKNGDALLELSLVPGGGDYFTRLSFPGPNAGDLVAVEVWRGRISRVDTRATSDNPASNPNLSISGVVAGFGLFALLGFGCAFWAQRSLATARSQLRRAR